jgi:flagellar protein FliS
LAKNNPLNAYRETSIKTASSSKLVLMLYDEALKQMDLAASLLEEKSKQYDAVNRAIIKSHDLITELMVSLDFEKGGEIAENLFSLYMFFNQQLMNANVNKDPQPIKSVHKMVSELREAWGEIIKNPSSSGKSSEGGLNIAG